jgi:hypothetical protein
MLPGSRPNLGVYRGQYLCSCQQIDDYAHHRSHYTGLGSGEVDTLAESVVLDLVPLRGQVPVSGSYPQLRSSLGRRRRQKYSVMVT